MYYNIQQLKQNKLNFNIFTFGLNQQYDFDHVNIGNDLKSIFRLIIGHSKLTSNMTTPLLIIIGKNNNNINNLIELLCNSLQKTGIKFNIMGTWANSNLIALNLLNLMTGANLYTYYMHSNSRIINNTAICININNLTLNSTFKYKIYMSQHPVKNMTQYNVIMPLKHYFEENGIYYNFQGVIQNTQRCVDNSEFLYNIYDLFYHQYFILNKIRFLSSK